MDRTTDAAIKPSVCPQCGTHLQRRSVKTSVGLLVGWKTVIVSCEKHGVIGVDHPYPHERRAP
jgi:hypothetical protein